MEYLELVLGDVEVLGQEGLGLVQRVLEHDIGLAFAGRH